MSEKVFKNTLKALKTARKELQNNKLISDESSKNLDTIIANADSPLTLLIMGEFSTGKSTFINAIVGKEIAAVGALPTTAVITKLCYGEEDKITIYFKDGKSKVYGQEEFAQITSETDDSKYKKIRKNIKYVERAMPMDILQYISLIDSPGLNALNQTHADITKEFVDNADAVLWMFSTDKAGSVTEIQAMEALNPRLKPIAIINQIDKLDPEEDDIETFLSDIKNKLRGKVLDVIGISSLMAYKGKTLGNEMLVEESNIRAVQNVMEDKVIPNRYDFKLKSLFDELGSFIWNVQEILNEFKENLEEQKVIDYEKYITEKSIAIETEAILEKIVLSVKDYCIEHAGLQNTPAAFVFNVLYYYGLSVDKNESKALEGLESIAIKNHYLAQKFLNSAYLKKEDYTKAFYWTKKAVEYGDKECQYALAELYFNGLGIEKNEAGAVKWYTKSAEQGDIRSKKRLYGYNLAKKEEIKKLTVLINCYKTEKINNIVFLIKEYIFNKEMLKYYTIINNLDKCDDKFEQGFIKKVNEIAKLGNAKAQILLGRCYEIGIGVKKDENEAVKWCQKAAEQGLAVAQYNLAKFYLSGIGVLKNNAEAFKWYKKAAEQGNVEAQYNLANCYFNGIGVYKSIKEAFKWYREAAEQGFAEAQNKLGYYYKNGYGVSYDNIETVRWYKKAAEQGNVEAQYNLANCYFNGIGADENKREAVKWYKKAAEQGNAKAQYNLANCYFNGIGVDENKREAVRWYKKAAEQNNVNAQWILGRCYEEGFGIGKNKTEAFKWYQKAAEQGLTEAKDKIAAQSSGCLLPVIGLLAIIMFIMVL